MIFNIKFSIIFTSKFLLYFYICLDKQKQITMSINKVSIVGIKGFKGSGKDTVASMISYILHDGIMKANYDTWLLYHKNDFIENDEIIIHFADKLKDDISEFCGIDRKLLDRQEIKENYYYNFKTGIVSTNIKDIDCENLRKNTAIVLQDTVLFADTVKNNLLYSRQDATDTEIIAAAKKANCHNMIMHLPGGYDSVLAKDGQNLSQGQRQLLSIARAFVASPKILILDEATSSVDTRTEKKIQDAMTNLMKNRTSLIIAHRLSTIQDADVIVVMDNGRVVETGNHESLLAAKGRYYELYMTQFAGKAI